jgi:Zn-dependent peptidase ImmA (M78 family)
MDREATVFAMHLLMPTDILQREIAKIGRPLRDIDVERLADIFQVPEMFMVLRLQKMGEI